MNQNNFYKTSIRLVALIPYFALYFWSGNTFSQSLQDSLFERVVAGSDCKQTVNNGLVCDYKIGNTLSFSIKDAGGADTVVGFGYSDISKEFYAVYYFGCIVVVPGAAHPRNYDRDFGVYVSPKNGRVYKTRQECQSVK